MTVVVPVVFGYAESFGRLGALVEGEHEVPNDFGFFVFLLKCLLAGFELGKLGRLLRGELNVRLVPENVLFAVDGLFRGCEHVIKASPFGREKRMPDAIRVSGVW